MDVKNTQESNNNEGTKGGTERGTGCTERGTGCTERGKDNICRNFMYNKCDKKECKYIHPINLCFYFWKNNSCKFNDKCKKSHEYNFKEQAVQLENRTKEPVVRNKKKRNTECFTPMTTPVDLRVVCDLGKKNDKLTTMLTTRDVLLAPNVCSDFNTGDLYNKLISEINECGVSKDKLLKLWHGNDKIEGTHLIADDKTRWKNECPTFNFVINRIKTFFNMDIQATRFNWYTDTSQWKPFHHDAAAVKADKADVQNFTVAVSFGATREAAFEHATTRTVVSSPQPDGWIYAFSKDTNIIWRHGILQDNPVRDKGRISIIAWGWVDNMKTV
jgi:hypothetical protein